MSSIDASITRIVRVAIADDTLAVVLSDGRSVAVPLAWYPRLVHSTPDERNEWRSIGGGHGIHWPALDEDVSVENLLSGKSTAESQRSLQRWLSGRNRSVARGTENGE